MMTIARTILAALAVLAAIPCRGAEPARSPEALKLLERYAQAQDKLASCAMSYTTRTATKGRVGGEWHDNVHFAEYELRCDGRRAMIARREWGYVSRRETNRPRDKAPRQFWMYDGANFNSYSPNLIPGRPARLMQRALDAEAGQRQISPVLNQNYLRIRVGKLNYNEAIEDVLRQADTLALRPGREKIGASDCFVLHATAGKDRHTVWIDPEHGYHIAKAVSDLQWDSPAGAVTTRTTIRVLRFERIDGAWVPMEVEHARDLGAPSEAYTVTATSRCTSIKLNPDHDALGSFSLDGVEEGSIVEILTDDPEGKTQARRGTWREGKAVFDGPATRPQEGGATPHATGRLRLLFTERSPLSERDEVLHRTDFKLENMGPDADRLTREYDLAEEPFDVYVPPTYRAGRPHGLFVWLGVGDLPEPWPAAIGRRGMILVSTAARIRGKGTLRRVQMPLDAVHNLRKLYTVDESRIYVGGFSAGAGVAASVVCAYPDVFDGACFLLGARFYQTRRNEGGGWDTTLIPMTPQWKGELDRIRGEMPLVFMRGQRDPLYSPAEDRGQAESLRQEGFCRVTYIEVPGLDHRLPREVMWLDRALDALENPRPQKPPESGPTTRPDPLPGQVAQAQRILATAHYWLDAGKRRDTVGCQRRARGYLRRVVEEYPTTPAATRARAMLRELSEE